MELSDGSRVAVVGGGPAGAFASYLLLDIAERVGLHHSVDIYEPKDFTAWGPGGCNNCGGIISEGLVQMLALEGINLSPTVVQRRSYVLHTDLGSVRIAGAANEKRIASVHRGAGPRGAQGGQWESFDGHLLGLARTKGANVVSARVDDVTWGPESRGCRREVVGRLRPTTSWWARSASTHRPSTSSSGWASAIGNRGRSSRARPRRSSRRKGRDHVVTALR
jgi:2-polyprenyl-6-methoxyphenol hydroxylase-like FAD-dependent oxidoreductase